MEDDNTSARIPIVDFSSCNTFDFSNIHETNTEIKNIAQEIIDAFTEIGFVYIKNHGIPQSQISKLFGVAKDFFTLSHEEKSKFSRDAKVSNHGYVGLGVETIDPSKPGDLKEAFNISELWNDEISWPDGSCSNFRPTVNEFTSACTELALKILDLVAIGLDLKDKTLMRQTHKFTGTKHNQSTLRILYYPVLKTLSKGEVRLGAHSDYGSITLLFQDEVGGLEVLDKNGKFKPVQPIEGTIVVNIADLLQRWSNDKLVSTKHRVVVPNEENLLYVSRQSAAFFVHPDNDVIIECLDGSRNYPPISSFDYLKYRLNETYLK